MDDALLLEGDGKSPFGVLTTMCLGVPGADIDADAGVDAGDDAVEVRGDGACVGGCLEGGIFLEEIGFLVALLGVAVFVVVVAAVMDGCGSPSRPRSP